MRLIHLSFVEELKREALKRLHVRFCFTASTLQRCNALFVCCLTLAFGTFAAFGQEQFQGVCAQVKIVIQQQLTLERIGFDARLEIANNDGSDPITDFSAALTFENPLLSTNGTVNDSSSLFFVQTPTFENINSVNGDGVIAPTTKAVIHWFIIPKPA